MASHLSTAHRHDNKRLTLIMHSCSGIFIYHWWPWSASPVQRSSVDAHYRMHWLNMKAQTETLSLGYHHRGPCHPIPTLLLLLIWYGALSWGSKLPLGYVLSGGKSPKVRSEHAQNKTWLWPQKELQYKCNTCLQFFYFYFFVLFLFLFFLLQPCKCPHCGNDYLILSYLK